MTQEIRMIKRKLNETIEDYIKGVPQEIRRLLFENHSQVPLRALAGGIEDLTKIQEIIFDHSFLHSKSA